VFNLTTFGAVEATPMAPVYCPNGELYASSSANNPLRYLGASGQEKNRRRQLYSTLNVNGDLSPITKGLSANLVISFDAYDVFESTQTNSINSYSYDYTNTGVTDINDFTYTQYSRYSELSNPTTHERANSWTINARFGFNYDRTFGKHHIDANAFIRSYQQRLNVQEASTDMTMYSSDRYLSFNGAANYIFDNRYVLNGSISRMGSDNFDPSDRWGTFWGVGGAWVASEESFLKNPNLDLLKVRMSYGKAGMNDTGAGRYPYQSTYGQSNGYAFGYNATWVTGYAEQVAGNPNSKWEVSKMYNFGLDWDLWNSKFYGSFDAFKEWRSNILVERSTIPSIIGISYAKDSYGKVESHGFELSIGHKNKIGKVSYQIEGMLSYNMNKITEMDETEPSVEWQRKTGGRIRDYVSVANLYEWENRDAIGGWNIYQFEQWASDPNLISTSQQDAIDHPEKYPYNSFSSCGQKLGTAVFKDLNGDRVIDSRDMSPVGYTLLPDLTPSLSLSVQYAGFDLKAILTAYLHRSVFLSPSMTFSEWGQNNATHEVTKAWGYYTDDPTDPRNINAKYPRLSYSYNTEDSSRDNGSYQNDIWIVNGDYLALRNIEFGYSLPEKLIAKAYMTKCRFYVSGYNLCNWSHLPKGMDPEKPMSYCWWYPKTRTISLGVNIAF
jgi:TonB-linked SusC/RagA family outer membrane protein